MILRIAQLGQPALRHAAVEVAAGDIAAPEFQRFIRDMLATLDAAGGVGLAAPQVFSDKRIFLAAVLPPNDPDAMPGIEIFINPVLTHASSEKATGWEGCLSFPELLVNVPRHRVVRMSYLDHQGQSSVIDLQGFPARVVQHELDHLNGILTLDRAPSTRDIIKASEIDVVLKKTAPPVGPHPAES
ncbi:MAG: peptide deformylase [Gemmataceae bacterium]